MMFSKALKGILLLVFFLPLAKYSVKVTQFVPHITLETYTGSSIMMAFLYGPIVGSISALVLGFYGYLSNSISKFLAFINVFVAALTCFLVGILLSNGILPKNNFELVFVIAIVFNNLVAYLAFLYADPDQIQNVVYRTTHLFWNSLISRLFFSLILWIYLLI
jgi:hypothetical protein